MKKVISTKLQLPIIIMLLLVSCKTVYVPVETEKVRTEYVTTEKIDSIYVKDSLYIKEKNDTILIYKEKIRYQYKMLTDTIIKTDSIPYTIIKPEYEYIETNRLYWYQKFLMGFGTIAIIVLFLYLGYLIFKLKFRK